MPYPRSSTRPTRAFAAGGVLAFLALVPLAGCGADDTGEGSPVVVDDSDAGSPATDAGGGPPDSGDPSPVDAGAPDDASRGDDTRSDGDGSSTADPGADDPDTGEPDESPSDCSPTEDYCDGRCVDVLSNPDNCGSCGFACNDTATCVNGICKCAGGNIRCDGRCVDPTSDDDHCFECGNACPDGQMCENSVCIEKNLQQAAIKYINQVRRTTTDCGQYGTKQPGPTLTINAELDRAAESYAQRMADKGFFAHEDPYDGSDFVERVNRTDYKGRVLGENLSRGLRQSAERVVDGWESSDSHCRVMADPEATELGLGHAELDSGKFDAYWVLLVGRR